MHQFIRRSAITLLGILLLQGCDKDKNNPNPAPDPKAPANPAVNSAPPAAAPATPANVVQAPAAAPGWKNPLKLTLPELQKEAQWTAVTRAAKPFAAHRVQFEKTFSDTLAATGNALDVAKNCAQLIKGWSVEIFALPCPEGMKPLEGQAPMLRFGYERAAGTAEGQPLRYYLLHTDPEDLEIQNVRIGEFVVLPVAKGTQTEIAITKLCTGEYAPLCEQMPVRATLFQPLMVNRTKALDAIKGARPAPGAPAVPPAADDKVGDGKAASERSPKLDPKKAEPPKGEPPKGEPPKTDPGSLPNPRPVDPKQPVEDDRSAPQSQPQE